MNNTDNRICKHVFCQKQKNIARKLKSGSVFIIGILIYSLIISSASSAPLDNWTSRTSGTTNTLYGITYADTTGTDTFVAVGNSGTILTSPTGTTWTSRTSGTANTLRGAAYGNSAFVAVGSSGTILTSPTGTTWTSKTSGTTYTLFGVAYGNSTFVAVGDGTLGDTILTSPTGTTWTSRTSPSSTYELYAITYGTSVLLDEGIPLFVAVGLHGKIITSADGITWTSRTSGTTEALRGITYGNSTFIVVGDSGTILTSTDGITWTVRDISDLCVTNDITSLYGITYGSVFFVAVGANGKIITSIDGITWAVRDAEIANTLYGITYGGSTFVAVGSSGKIIQSATIDSGDISLESPSKLEVLLGTDLLLQWDDESYDEDGFEIWRKVSSGLFFLHASHAASPSAHRYVSYTDEAVTTGVTYTYKVRAYGKNGYSNFSNEEDGTPWDPIGSDPTGPGGGAVGPLAVGISALLGWWKRRKQKNPGV